MSNTIDQFKPGQKVAITQQIAQRDDTWTIRVEGTVIKAEQKKTGSWFARSKDDRLWLDRLTIRKDDGEIIVSILDPYTRVELLADAPSTAPAPAASAAADDAPAEA